MQEQFIEGGKTLSVRFTDKEAEFINENYERITETAERWTFREFFVKAVENAVSMVKPKVAETSRPEDVAEIEKLRTLLVEANTDIETKAKYIDDITQSNIDLEKSIFDLSADLSQANSTIREKENLPEVLPIPDGALVLELSEAEQALINDYASLLKTTPKDVLINKLFINTVLNGPGDWIPIPKAAVRTQLKATFRK